MSHSAPGRSTTDWTVHDPVRHGRQVRSMFARIAGVYDFMNHLLSLNLDRRWRRHLIARLDDDVWEVLDLCAGTGDLALAGVAAGKGRVHLAADFCPEMLVASRRKRGQELLRLAAADALALPFPDRSVDAVMVAFGVRNLADVRRGLAEMTRVLRPAGQLLVLEFFRDDPAAGGEEKGAARPLRAILSRLLPACGFLFARDRAAYSYLPASMEHFLTPGEFVALLQEMKYENTFVLRQTGGIAHLVGARRPT